MKKSRLAQIAFILKQSDEGAAVCVETMARIAIGNKTPI